MSQDQFLEVIDRDEAERRFHAALRLEPLEAEEVGLDECFDRVLAEDIIAGVDVPSFDRSNYDGYAVRAADTFGASEEEPRRLKLLGEVIATGVVPRAEVGSGEAAAIATGGMIPRGADAVVMVEHTDIEEGGARTGTAPILLVRHAVTAGFGISFTGSDIAAGETILRRGEVLASRETGVLAAVGRARVLVRQRPRVAVLSTGDEIIPPGEEMRPGLVYDSNARILADAVRELGGLPRMLGIVRDDIDELRARLHEAITEADAVLLSGGTSKGAGDLSYRVVRELSEPGVVAHGVALKPGKPICLAAHRGKPVVILPGFPTSAIFTFHEFVAPVILRLGARPAVNRPSLGARLAVRVNSEIGRTEYLLVGLADTDAGPAAYPMGKGSGSVTAFSRADGFITVGRHEELVEAGASVKVTLFGAGQRLADLIVIGSHCTGLDYLLGLLRDQGFHTKFLAVGSTAGLEAARRGECDLAGMHLLDPRTGQYNRPFLPSNAELIEGYGRQQGVVFRPGDPRFEGRDAAAAIDSARLLPGCRMVNRNQGSGTRILIDRLLAGAKPAGYSQQARSHNAVAAAVVQRRADWGVAIRWAAEHNRLGFLPLGEEHYDFACPTSRAGRPAVHAFRQLLARDDVRARLREMGFVL